MSGCYLTVLKKRLSRGPGRPLTPLPLSPGGARGEYKLLLSLPRSGERVAEGRVRGSLTVGTKV